MPFSHHQPSLNLSHTAGPQDLANDLATISLSLSSLSTSSSDRPLLDTVRLPRDGLFGITTIIGGTNVRFCVSLPGWVEPIVHVVTWEEAQDSAFTARERCDHGLENLKSAVFNVLARRFLDFIGTIAPEDGCLPPFESLHAFNISVAGIVNGEGIDAKVTTANTGVPIRGEPIGRYLANAIRDELSARRWGHISFASSLVMNDAVAGALGEYTLGGLRGCDTALYLIVGTGVGSMGLRRGKPYFRYSQMGQNITYNSFLKTFAVGEGTDVLSTIDEEGNFKEPPAGLHYVENYLGGPWLAARFIKKLCSDYDLHPLVYQLAHHITPLIAERDQENILSNLLALGDLPSKTRHKWASLAPGDIVKAINGFLLDPALPLTSTSLRDSRRSSDRSLTRIAATFKRRYFEDIGRAIGALATKMRKDGFPPQKIVIGGGIGEVCGRYPIQAQRSLLDTIHHYAGTSVDLIAFSSMSAAARECAVTTHHINDANRARRAKTRTFT